MFPPDTARKLCHEVKSPTRFFRDLNRRLIWRESTARLPLTDIWPLWFEAAPVFRRPTRSVGCDERQSTVGMVRCAVGSTQSFDVPDSTSEMVLAFGMSAF